MRHFAVVFLMTAALTGAVPYANNMERDDPLTPPPPVESNEPLSEAADPARVSWAGVYEGDMILTDEQARDLYDNSTERQAKRKPKYLWPHAVIPYQIDSKMTSSELEIIDQAFNTIAQETCLRLIKRTNQPDYVSIFVYKRLGACGLASVGRRRGRQTLVLRCFRLKTILHEFMHTVGFHHEQSRYDRDRYVKIHWENIKHKGEKNFKLNTKSETSNLGERYDYNSIMHYSATAFSTDKENGLVTIERLDDKTGKLGSDHFSQIDIKKLNKLYSCDTRGCKDKSPYCPYLANKNYCTTWMRDFMTRKCKQSCNLCGSLECVDKYTGCPGFADTYCAKDKWMTWMAKYCAKSCNKC